jgi:hypothetical protein
MASKTVSGIFGGAGTPAVGSWDAMHSFSTRRVDGFGGKLHSGGGYAGGTISKALEEFYKTEKLNPCITSMKITVDPVKWTVAWEVTIEESPDGKAYVGLNSWGGASGGYPAKKPPAGHAYSNYEKEKKSVLGISKGAEIKNVLDFYFPGGFRQIFFQYTRPKSSFVNLPMSANAKKGTVGAAIGAPGSPAGLPEYNGISVPCVTYDGAVVTPVTTTNTTPPPLLLKRGSKGEEVKKVQGKLGLTADGDFGKGTEKAVIDWQKLNGLIPNGVVNQETWDKLFLDPSKLPPDGSDWDTTDPYTNNPVVEVIDPLKVSGKFILRVKSGPGVLIGVTEVDIVDGVAKFSGIEFDTKGDYIVTVSSTSPDIEPIDITIKVGPEQQVIPQEEKKTQEEKPVGTRPIIAQIDQPTINPPKIEIDTVIGNIDAAKFATTIRSTPFISYNGIPISDREIVSMTLYHDGIIPKLDITFRDSTGILSKEPPRDDTKFDLYIGAKSNVLKSIHLVFKIEDYSKLENNLYQFFGTIDVSDLYRMKFKVYRGTSFDALRAVCKELGLGFNSNIVNTKDEMPWRNIGDKRFKFIQHIIKHSYASEESFMSGYIDYYYCFNYVDIEKEMKRDIKNDVGVDTGKPDDGKDEPSDVTKLILFSEKSYQLSCMYFQKVSERNESTKTSLEQGYKTRTKFYDKVKKMFLVFDVDSTTSDGSKSHILKGATNDKESFDNNYVTKYEGKIDTDNAHKNYNYAVTQNGINLDNMLKNQMDIRLPNPNFNLYKYQKIQVNVVKDQGLHTNPEIIEWRWSGEWLILDIRYEFSKGRLSQFVTLVRKEMGKDLEEKQQKQQPKVEEKIEKTENPPVDSVRLLKANSSYEVGEEYTVVDEENKRYVIKINKISEDGNYVDADIRDIDAVVNQVVTNPESVSGMTGNTGTTSGILESSDTSGTSGTSGSSGVSDTSGAKYWPEIKFTKRQNVYASTTDVYEMSQEMVTRITQNYREYFGPNEAGLKSGNVGRIIEADENISDQASLFIAIRRPIPDFKPVKDEKKNTPHSWILYELYDEGMTGTDVPSTNIGTKFSIIKSRFFSEYESYTPDGTDDKIEQFRRPRGSISILRDGNPIIDSVSLSPGGNTIDSLKTTGENYIFANFKEESGGWFSSTDANSKNLKSDQLYTNVGGKNTILIDLSNPTLFTPGNYTLKIVYTVPKLKGVNRLIEPKDSNEYSPYEQKIFEEKFTISKKSIKKD